MRSRRSKIVVRSLPITVALLTATLPGAEARAQQPNGNERAVIPIARLSAPIELDGIVDEAAWLEIEPIPMIMWAPTHGGEMTERTEVRIAYDDRYLYMSGRMYDSDPSGIRLNTFYRDQFSGDDLIAIIIDSYNDYETGVWFVTNPGGARTDRSLSNDGEFTARVAPGGRGFGVGAMNSDWNSHWDVATHRNEEGWFAEFRIPFSTLGFQMRGDEVTMGIIVYRYLARRNERHLYPAISREYGDFGFAKPSQAQRVTLRGIRRSTPVYVTPYLLGGVDQLPVLRSPPAVPDPRWDTDDDLTTEPGVDLKYSPSSNLALDLTVNTDFAQVEADDQQINLTRFPLFFPEKRQFFQERASTFEFNTGGSSDRLFFSRRIGLNEGEIVRIYGGARLVGRLGGMDFGFLNMQTASQRGRAGENMGVLRLNQKVLNPYSTIGGILTTRVGSDGEDNVAYGLDADLRLFGDEYLTVKWAQTFDEAVEEGGALDAGLIRARWERQTDAGLSYFAEYGRVGPDYLPRLGFQTRDDFSFYGARLQYQWFPGASSPFRNVTLSGTTGNYFRNEDNSAESLLFEPQLEFEFKNASQISLGFKSSYESVRDTFPIAELFIPPDDYWFHEGSLRAELSRNALFRGSVNVTAGSFYDGTRFGVGISPTWNVSRHLELSAGYNVNHLDFSDRDVATTTHLGSLRLDVALDTHLSLSTFAQYNSVVDQTTINARFRYHFREGTDLWVVYNEGFNLERANGLDPRLPVSAGRTIMVKYSHTFVW